MGIAIDTIKAEIEVKEIGLENLRKEYDETDTNNSRRQVEIALEISQIVIELAQLKRLLILLGGG